MSIKIESTKVRWIIQDKNHADDDRQQIIDACKKLGIPYQEITIIPFSDELPEFPVDDEYENIYYGSVSMMGRVYRNLGRPVGLFFDHKTFSMENYVKQWGKHMLNSEVEFMELGEFINRDYPSDKYFFIRPDADSKAFNGIVLTFGEVAEWYDRLDLSPYTKIMVGPAYSVEKEWRNYVVNGKVITSSMYKKNHILHRSADDIPPEMIKFVEDRCREYTPHDVFAMDIAKCSGEHEYYIIECGCMNAVGFYCCDIHKYVEALSNYVANRVGLNNDFF
jgi:hypothetical protein